MTLTIKTGKNAGQHPSVASVYRVLADAEQAEVPVGPDECTGSYGCDGTLAKVTAALARDGYQVSPTLQILPVGEWRPEVARHDARAYAESLRLLRGARNAMERLGLLTSDMP
ncbi:hypothetical protein [Streptomyces sp. NPDC005538]|uniref:hypothetical protein n=1 Tax=unclassified Streptomyces TaxID=2593676 RepID=UPI0033AB17F5